MEKQALGPNQLAWIAALRSGEFKQGEGCLHSIDNTFCCLGVLCVVAGDERFDKSSLYYAYGERDNTHGASKKAVEFAALGGALGQARRGEPLYMLNDRYGKTFAEIADIIEADPAQYFTEPR